MPALGPLVETYPRNRNPRGGAVHPLQPYVALSVPFSEVDGDPTTPVSYSFDITSSGDQSAVRTVRWDVVPAALNPITADRFQGGVYPGATVDIPAGQQSVTVGFTLAALADPPANLFASLVLSAPVGCQISTGRGVWPFDLKGSIVPTDAILALDVPVTRWGKDAAAQHTYTVNVLRTGDTTVSCSATLAVAGTGTNPLAAGDFVGGLLSTTVNFNPGDTLVPLTVTTVAAAAAASDETGQVSLSAPSGCKINPTAASVAVVIPHAIIVNPGVLPPEYTDPDFTGMTAYSPAPTTWAELQTAAAALSNNALCKTKYIELAATFDYGTTQRVLSWSGYVDPVTKLIYPLIITGPLAQAKLRDPGQKPHFSHVKITGTWLWFYNHACELPIDGVSAGVPYQTDNDPAVLYAGTDCFMTRLWIDAPLCFTSGYDAPTATPAGVRGRIGANDLYGTPDPNGDSLTESNIRLECQGKTVAIQHKPVGMLMYQNFMSQLRESVVLPDSGKHPGMAFYTGQGVDKNPPDHSQPYDLNLRDCWFFNNLILTQRKYMIYNKHALNVWRNRVANVVNWNDTVGHGAATHFLASRGGNWLGGTWKYNVVEGKSSTGSSIDVQGWNGVAEFNDFGGIEIDIFFHLDQASGKTLLAAKGWRFRGNQNGKYVVGAARNSVYHYYAPLLDVVWEAEQSATWNWQGNNAAGSYSPNGGAIAWAAATGKNTQTLTFTESGQPAKTAVAAGQLRKAATTTVTPQLTLAYAANGFTAAEKGIASSEGLVWDHVGDGGGGGDPYALDSSLMTVWYPSDNMPVDYPHTTFTWLPGFGNGFECKAQNSPSDGSHACMNVWHKNAPPDGDCEFNFYATILDANTTAQAGADGIFGLFRVRQKGLATYGADPNLWAKASYRGPDHTYTTPGGDQLIRDRTSGYRHSFANHAQTTANSMQFRCRVSDGGDDGLDNSVDVTPTTPNPVPTNGQSFLLVQGEKYLINYRRVDNTVTAVKTKVSDGTTQTWAFTDARLGPSGDAVGGWCGFGVYIGRWLRIEPVPGIPFCQAI